tara:strand:+ start:206 stop:400 length:195 start_codon:yes stop_codon:yes gene_type:complete
MNKEEEERIVQASLEGTCLECGERLPAHEGFCGVMQSETQLELEFNAEDIVFNMSYQLGAKGKL